MLQTSVWSLLVILTQWVERIDAVQISRYDKKALVRSRYKIEIILRHNWNVPKHTVKS